MKQIVEAVSYRPPSRLAQARVFLRLAEEFGMTHGQIAEAVNRSRCFVTNALRLLTLPEDVQQMLEREEITQSHARQLVGHPRAIEAAREMASRRLSVRMTRVVFGRIESRFGVVYFLRAGDDGPVKIGWSASPRTRVQDLQHTHFKKLHLIGLRRAGRRVEAEYHHRFREYCLKGEWYAPVDEIMTEAARYRAYAPDDLDVT